MSSMPASYRRPDALMAGRGRRPAIRELLSSVFGRSVFGSSVVGDSVPKAAQYQLNCCEWLHAPHGLP